VDAGCDVDARGEPGDGFLGEEFGAVVANRDAEAGHLGGDFGDVVVVVDAELNQPPGRCVNDFQLLAALSNKLMPAAQSLHRPSLVITPVVDTSARTAAASRMAVTTSS
jgi:hypothetical protein